LTGRRRLTSEWLTLRHRLSGCGAGRAEQDCDCEEPRKRVGESRDHHKRPDQRRDFLSEALPAATSRCVIELQGTWIGPKKLGES
jgi:hypothetical protein